MRHPMIEASAAGMVDGSSALQPAAVLPRGDKRLSRKQKKKLKKAAFAAEQAPAAENLQLLQPPCPADTEPSDKVPQEELPAAEEAVQSAAPPCSTTEEAAAPSFRSLRTAVVAADSELPQPDNCHVLEDTGIIYEVAEELYRREKTAAEIEALCQPPFRKVFDENRLRQLDRQAEARTRELVGSAADSTAPDSAQKGEHQPLSTATAFFTQLLLMLPGVNLVYALVLSFNARANRSKRAFCRAFLVWTVLAMTAALGFLTFQYVNSPYQATLIDRVQRVFAA